MGMGSDNFDLTKYIGWKPPGPISAAFLASDIDFPFILGPVGSGKSTTADVVKPLLKGMLQVPGEDGHRHYKLITFRNTQRSAFRSTIPTFFKWIPETIGVFKGSEDRPCEFKFTAEHPIDGGLIHYEFHWWGMPENRELLEEKLRGVETSDINFAEGNQLPLWGFEYCIGRIGRHPSGILGSCMMPQIWGTFNATDFDNWLYQMLVENPELYPRASLFWQPGGIKKVDGKYVFNEKCENIEGLGGLEKAREYYLRQAETSRPGYIKHALMAEFGPVDAEGFVVYHEFEQACHVQSFNTSKRDLFLGIDAGGTPAASLQGWGPNGEIDVCDEIVLYDPNDPKRKKLKTGVGPREFAAAVRAKLSLYPDCDIKIGFIDPSAFYGGNSNFNDLAFADVLKQELGINIQPAPCEGNARVYREAGMREYLGKRGSNGAPMMRIHPNCKMILQGLRGGFEYLTINKGGQLIANDKKQVNKFHPSNHIMEALEYGVCGMTGGKSVFKTSPLMLPKGFNKNQSSTYKRSEISW